MDKEEYTNDLNTNFKKIKKQKITAALLNILCGEIAFLVGVFISFLPTLLIEKLFFPDKTYGLSDLGGIMVGVIIIALLLTICGIYQNIKVWSNNKNNLIGILAIIGTLVHLFFLSYSILAYFNLINMNISFEWNITIVGIITGFIMLVIPIKKVDNI